MRPQHAGVALPEEDWLCESTYIFAWGGIGRAEKQLIYGRKAGMNSREAVLGCDDRERQAINARKRGGYEQWRARFSTAVLNLQQLRVGWIPQRQTHWAVLLLFEARVAGGAHSVALHPRTGDGRYS